MGEVGEGRKNGIKLKNNIFFFTFTNLAYFMTVLVVIYFLLLKNFLICFDFFALIIFFTIIFVAHGATTSHFYFLFLFLQYLDSNLFIAEFGLGFFQLFYIFWFINIC